MKVIHICMVATFKNQLHNYCSRQIIPSHIFPRRPNTEVKTLQQDRGTDAIHKPPNGKKKVHLGG